MAKLLIRDAKVVDPSQGLNGRADILVEDGHIADVRPRIASSQAARIIEGKGLVAVPGFIDLHVHLREPGNEGAESIESGTQAAAAGGFTTIYAMPNTSPICDSITGVHYILSRAAAVGCVRVVPIAAVTTGQQGTEITQFGMLHAAGAGAFSDDGNPVANAEIMRRALEYTKLFDAPIFDHCEDMNLTGSGVMHEGAMSLRLGLKGIPRASESIMVARDCALAALTGGHVHICHVSARESVEAIREAKRNGVRVTAEVTPHHLTMTDKAVAGYNTNAKMKPPLNAEKDREALVAALEDGTIDCIATDHAPHSSTAKNSVFDAAPFGIIGLESAFPVLYTHFVKTGRWPLEFLVEKMTSAPARVVKRPWGSLKTGAPADIALLQLDVDYEFEARHLRSKSRNCPWLGARMNARIAATIHDGRVVFESEDVFPHDSRPTAPHAASEQRAQTNGHAAPKKPATTARAGRGKR